MFCPKCGAANPAKYSFCPNCGATSAPAAPSTPIPGVSIPGVSIPGVPASTSPLSPPQGVYVPAPVKPKRKLNGWTIGFIILCIVAAMNGQNVFQYLSTVITGQVSLSPRSIEQNIRQTIQTKTGLSVTVTCPDPFQGKVGDVRQCTIDEPLGISLIVDVTIENTSGAFTWQVRNL